MILPGLVSVAFYRRRPTMLQIALGLVFTIVVSGLLGYIQDYGTPRVWENTIVAIAGGIILYFVILVYLAYYYLPKRERARANPEAPPAHPPP